LSSGLANIIPRTKRNRISGIFILNTCPPEFSNNGIDLGNKSFGKKNCGHIVNRDRRKD
jgi:hypothetical protein